tara:strand:- start:843 stop:1496 length:654 start_codon:yes stop_codon:yes gene_type:complete
MAIELAAEKRDIFGKKLAKERAEQRLPAIVYGPKETTMPIFISSRDFIKTWKETGETGVITLKVDGADKEVLIHEISYDPVRETPLHVDFYAIEKGKKIAVNVPLVFEGVAPAVKELSGILVKVLHEIEIETIPSKIPHEIVVDISKLVDFDSHITVADIKLPDDVVTTLSADETVVSVSAPREEEEEEEVVEADLSQIEVEKKGKREEDTESEEEK